MTSWITPILRLARAGSLAVLALALCGGAVARTARTAGPEPPPFSDVRPSRIIPVSPGQPIEPLLRQAEPGVALVFDDGVYGPIKLPRGLAGTREHPIWLISRRLHGAQVSTIEGGASKNLVIEGFHVTSEGARNGIEIAADVGGNGRGFVWSDPDSLVENIVIRDVLVDPPAMDAVKVTGATHVWILDSDLSGGMRGQGIDVDASRQVFILRNRVTTLGPLASLMVKFGTVDALIEANDCWSRPGAMNDGIHIGDRSGPQAPPPHAADASGRLAFEARQVTSRGNRCVVAGRPLVFMGAAPPCQSVGDYLASTADRTRLIVGGVSKEAPPNQSGKPGPGHPELPSGACEVIGAMVPSTDRLLHNVGDSAVNVTGVRLMGQAPKAGFGPTPYAPPGWLQDR